MLRIAVGIEYDGAAYAGWQVQPGQRTLQGELEAALTRIADSPVSLVVAGRTDAGVHASAQVAHFDTSARRTSRAWVSGANSALACDVSLSWAATVPAHFHARYSAEARCYRYLICNRPARPALAAKRATWVYRVLDAPRMHLAAQGLVGEHDFSAFRAAGCQSRSPVRRVDAISVERRGEWVVVDITANAFLHHMARNIAGLLIAIGQGERPPGEAAAILASRDRGQAPATAAAHGLYLAGIRYPAAFGLPAAPGEVALAGGSAMIPRILASP
jgi:tRNA pseudouridine38-40 synthase